MICYYDFIGKEFCLSFFYYVDGPQVNFYIAAGDYQTGIPGLPGSDYKILWRYERTSNNYQKWVYFRDTLVGIPWGLFVSKSSVSKYHVHKIVHMLLSLMKIDGS